MISLYRSSTLIGIPLAPRYALRSRSSSKEPLRLGDRFHQGIDVSLGIVDVAARPVRRRHVEALHQRLRAVMPGPDGHSLTIEDRRHIVRVDQLVTVEN